MKPISVRSVPYQRNIPMIRLFQGSCTGDIDHGKLCVRICRCMGDVPEVPEWSAAKLTGRGLETTGCTIKPCYACQLDHLLHRELSSPSL